MKTECASAFVLSTDWIDTNVGPQLAIVYGRNIGEKLLLVPEPGCTKVAYVSTVTLPKSSVSTELYC